MDQAVYASGSTVIIGIRGNRVFQLNATTGAVQNQADLPPFGWGKGSIAYDSVSNKIFAAVSNTPHYAIKMIGGFNEHVSQRNLYRVNPSTLAIEITDDIATTFSLGNQNGVSMSCGICAMDSAVTAGVGWIYCRWWATPVGAQNGGTLRFQAGAIGTFVNANEGIGSDSPNLVYGKIGTDDNAIWCDQSTAAGVNSGQIVLFDYTSSTLNTFNTNPTNAILAVGFAANSQHIIVTDVAQFIYVYATNGALITTLDTHLSNFNGLTARYDATDGTTYIAGGNSNTIIQLNTLGNAILNTYTGFDCPVDYVRAGSTRFAVQSGATPLKAF